MTTHSNIDPRAVEAFRALNELIHRPTERQLRRALDHDWSEFESIRRILERPSGPPTPEAAGLAARELLAEALASLADEYPRVDGRLSPVDVLERHLLLGHSWDAITTEQAERGVPVSERTLRTRQREGLEIVLRFLRREAMSASARTAPDRDDAAPAGDPHATAPRPLRRRLRPRAIAGVVVVCALSAAFVLVSKSGDVARGDRPSSSVPLGIEIALGDGRVELPDPYPPWRLPVIGSPLDRAILVEPSRGRPKLLIGARQTGADAGAVLLYDPERETVDWKRRFDPPADVIEDSDELFWASQLVYGRRGANLGATAMVVFVHRNASCFVVELDLASGEIVGQYLHPGRLESFMVEDVDGDGTPEVYLGGQDNVLDQPVLAAFHPGHVHGTASTVSDRGAPTDEGACARVLLPAVPALQAYWGIDRLQVVNSTGHRWDPGNGILSFDVGASNEVLAYRVRLDADLLPVRRGAIDVGEGPARAWRSAGRDPSDVDSLAAAIRTIRGAGRAADGPMLPH